MQQQQLTSADWEDAELIWEYHQVHHEPRPCSAAIALGCNDLNVAAYAADLYHRGLFSIIVFSGANSPDTLDLFPRGEAVHFRDHAVELGIPGDAILVEPEARNTGANITLSRELLASADVTADSVMLVSMPYMERRAYATCRRLWPEVTPICASAPLTLKEYVKTTGSAAEIFDMMVGDLQRVMEYPKRGFAIEQAVPVDVCAAYARLTSRGFNSRLLR